MSALLGLVISQMILLEYWSQSVLSFLVHIILFQWSLFLWHLGVFWLPLASLFLFKSCGCHRKSCDCHLASTLIVLLWIGPITCQPSSVAQPYSNFLPLLQLYSVVGEKLDIKMTFSVTHLQLAGLSYTLDFYSLFYVILLCHLFPNLILNLLPLYHDLHFIVHWEGKLSDNCLLNFLPSYLIKYWETVTICTYLYPSYATKDMRQLLQMVCVELL